MSAHTDGYRIRKSIFWTIEDYCVNNKNKKTLGSLLLKRHDFGFDSPSYACTRIEDELLFQTAYGKREWKHLT